MKYNLVTAADAIGVSKATMHRYVKKGRVAATRTDDDHYEIDPAELHRVFPPVSETGSRDGSRDNVKPGGCPIETAVYTAKLEGELEKLKALAAVEEARRLERDRRIADLESERDKLLRVIEEQAGTMRM